MSDTLKSQIRLRGSRKYDVGAISDIIAGDGVVHGLSVMPFTSEFDVERMLQSTECRHWIIAELDASVAGFVYLDWGKGRWRQIGLLGMGVDDRHVGRGVGTALIGAALRVGFYFLDLEKIELVVYIDNAAAIRLYEKAGFIHEGTKRGNAIRDGQYIDAHVMSLLKHDWLLASKAR
jgi:L-phenylalanine/L-methionine N-acetyltransferase